VPHLPMWPYVAIFRRWSIEFKDNLSRDIRRIEAAERIAITAHARVVAELVPPGTARRSRGPSRFDELVAAGVIRPSLETGTRWKISRTSDSCVGPPRN
jgi:antitoxin (DNA-binding transcriptional repressor) of toxin-antitoxin stability system